MTYNWEEIFEDKSDKELYEIYCGNSLLPVMTIPFAKNELKKRNFDFENMELHNEEWKLSRLEEEIDYLKLEILRRTPISLKTYTIIIIALVVFAVIVSHTFDLENRALFLSMTSGIVLVTISIIIERFIYKKRVESLNKLLEKKSKIVENISEKVNLNEKQHILENLSEESSERIKQSLTLNKTLFIIIAIILLLYLAFRFVF
jgi:hypothetical protein